MKKDQVYISTIDDQAGALASKYDLGLELAEYCTAWNMDEKFTETDKRIRQETVGISRLLLHAPFSELFPCAIDPKARVLADQRYKQALLLARDYGAKKIIIHGGYNPGIYYPSWYIEQSIRFWTQFLDELDVSIVLENVFEEEPEMLIEIVKTVNDPRLRLCLDIGHVNAYSKISVFDWLNLAAPYISHFHIHNNDGKKDTHSCLCSGTIPMREFLAQAEHLCMDATFTIETPDAESSVYWLLEEMV